MRFIDLSGQRFGRLTVAARAKNDQNARVQYLCLCSCGNQVSVRACSLRSGDTKSCGCLRSEGASTRAKTRIIHGHAVGKPSTEYQAYLQARQRCTNPKKNVWYL